MLLLSLKIIKTLHSAFPFFSFFSFRNKKEIVNIYCLRKDWKRFFSSSPSFACLLDCFLLRHILYVFLPTHLPTILPGSLCCYTLIFLSANKQTFLFFWEFSLCSWGPSFSMNEHHCSPSTCLQTLLLPEPQSIK